MNRNLEIYYKNTLNKKVYPLVKKFIDMKLIDSRNCY